MLTTEPPGKAGAVDHETSCLLFHLWQHDSVLLEVPLRPCTCVKTFKQLLSAAANARLVDCASGPRVTEEGQVILKALQKCSITSLQHGLPVDDQVKFCFSF